MDNFDKLHKDQDDFIKGVFQEDKIVVSRQKFIKK